MKRLAFGHFCAVFLFFSTQSLLADDLPEDLLSEDVIDKSQPPPIEYNKRDGFKEVEKNCFEPSFSERQCTFEKNKTILKDIDKNKDTNASQQYKDDIVGEILAFLNCT